MNFSRLYLALLSFSFVFNTTSTPAEDHIRELQTEAVKSGSAPWGYWGTDPNKYSTWASHSNRLIPVYTFGIKLDQVAGEHSVYRSAEALEKLYGRLPEATQNITAEYFDQTDVYRLQKQAAAAGKKKIILIVFDGMDWWTTWAAACYQTNKVAYREGRGTGLNFQDYRGVATDFGCFVTSPYMSTGAGTKINMNKQTFNLGGHEKYGGYDFKTAGITPWSESLEPAYPIGKGSIEHPYTDSSASMTSMTTGIKTYNEGINVDHEAKQVETIAHQLQRQNFAIGVVTSVPFSHATPACTYSHNVSRDDYQDLSRDLVGLPSISHPDKPLPGVDVLIGAGWGETLEADSDQGTNFVPGNRYITDDDLKSIDAANHGKYSVAQRTAGKSGKEILATAGEAAVANKTRLFGFFGLKSGHLPFRTADGNYDPTISVPRRSRNDRPLPNIEEYTKEDLIENPTLADFATTAIEVLGKKSDRFWLMIEAGDVDWANHANNIDNSIGAVQCGDAAFKAVVNWVEAHNAWDETAIILTADHGHYLHLTRPDLLIGK